MTRRSLADWSGAIIFLIIAIISVLSYWFMRKRYVEPSWHGSVHF